MLDQIKTVTFITCFFVILLSFWLGVICERIIFKPNIKISYISHSELVELERIRIKNLPSEKKQFFLGRPEEAVKLISMAKQKRESNHSIILISKKEIVGKNVKSISKEVHNEIIDSLKLGRK